MTFDPDLRQLRAFAAVHDTGSVSAAARKVHLTQPALSRRISELESSLGIRLFDRTAGRLRLTSEGESLLMHSRKVLAEAESFVTRAETLREGRGRTLAVGTAPMTMQSVIAPVMRRYLREHDGVDIRLVEGGAPALLDKVEKGELQVALSVPLKPTLEHRPLFPLRTLAVSSAASRIPARAKTVRLEDLVAEPLLMLPRGFVHRNALEAACELMQIRPNIVFESTVPDTLLTLARIGYGIAIIPSAQPVRDESLRTHVVVYEGHSMGSWMGVNWDPRRFVPDYMQDFIEGLAEHVRKHSPDRKYRSTPPVLSHRDSNGSSLAADR
jgi:LysR family transcriptional regulator, transcription activator of glutamate synthase operon